MHLRFSTRWFALVLSAAASACSATADDTPHMVTATTGGAGATTATTSVTATTSGAGGGTSGTGSTTSSTTGGDTGGTGGTGGASDDAGGTGGSSDVDAGSSPDAPAPPIDAGGKRAALLVWGHGEHLPTPKPTDPPMAFDITMKNRLEARGFSVEMIVDALSKATDATGKTLVVISSSINRDNLIDAGQARFKNVPVPTIVMKDGTIEVMGLGMGSAGGYSTDVGQTQLTIVAPGDPLAAGLTGNVNVYTKGDRLIWSHPGPQAKKIATIVGHADEVGIFAYAAGQAMVTGTAPAKRMAFFIHRNTDYSPDGLKLFDAAVDYLIAP